MLSLAIAKAIAFFYSVVVPKERIPGFPRNERFRLRAVTGAICRSRSGLHNQMT